MPHSISLAASMNLEHSIQVESHDRYPVHLQCLRNIKKIKYPDFQAMTSWMILLYTPQWMNIWIILWIFSRYYESFKISPLKCQFFKKKIVYMGLEFQVEDDKVCYTPLKDKCEAIQNLDSPKTLKQTRAFCGMVNFLSAFLPNLRRLLIPIYNLQMKSKKFKWTEEVEKAFKDIKRVINKSTSIESTHTRWFVLFGKQHISERCGRHFTPETRK